jgi:hypothetical protein
MRRFINKYDDEDDDDDDDDDDENARQFHVLYVYIFIQKQVIF